MGALDCRDKWDQKEIRAALEWWEIPEQPVLSDTPVQLEVSAIPDHRALLDILAQKAIQVSDFQAAREQLDSKALPEEPGFQA